MIETEILIDKIIEHFENGDYHKMNGLDYFLIDMQEVKDRFNSQEKLIEFMNSEIYQLENRLEDWD